MVRCSYPCKVEHSLSCVHFCYEAERNICLKWTPYLYTKASLSSPTLPRAFPNSQKLLRSFKHDSRPNGRPSSRSRTSICLRSLGTPSGITTFHPDQPSILTAFINSVVHSHLRWRCHLGITAR